MQGKYITAVQQSHIAGLITGLVMIADKQGMNWNKQHRQDIEIAFKAIGQPLPFKFADAAPEHRKPTLSARLKGLISARG